MDILTDYESEETLDIPWENIVKNVITEACREYSAPDNLQVSVTFTDEKKIHELNLKTRGIDRATDVLSFPMFNYSVPGDFSDPDSQDSYDPDTGEYLLGDVVLCVQRIKSQAAEYGHSETRELAFLTAHSMLHLFGFDHMEDEERRDMEQRQEKILEALGYTRDMEEK